MKNVIRLSDKAKPVAIFDTSGNLAIKPGSVQVAGQAATFTMRPPAGELGAAVEVDLPANCYGKDCSYDITMEYSTNPEKCSAVQWLPPEQTAGKKTPYLFTQCQAIHCRSMVPCQDTPFIKAKYTANITVPEGLVALMSAISLDPAEGANGAPKGSTSDGKTTYRFSQAEPIPSYLIALVVGDLECRSIGPRSKVWAEAAYVEAAAKEFDQTEDFIQAAESLVGPYVWGRYDILCLPPSFPYGGMENPCLTFVTPTLLAGDRSLADVVAHEIAHSWTGNLVGCATWEHFWLNEGHTVFLERKIMGRLKGEKGQPGGGPMGQRYFEFKALLGLSDLKDSIEEFRTKGQMGFTRLVPTLGASDPDDAFSSVPYEKGCNLLCHLEKMVGGPSVFEPYLLAYVQHFQRKSITSDEFKGFFINYFKERGMSEQVANLDWAELFFGEGLMAWEPNFDSTLADAALNLAKAWLSGDDAAVESTSTDSFDSHQWEVFLDNLLQQDAPPAKATVLRIIEKYQFLKSRNSEIRFRYQRLALMSGCGPDEPSIAEAVCFLKEQGRMKFVRPLYRNMFRNPLTKQLALDTFQANRTMYHGVAAKMIARDLEL